MPIIIKDGKKEVVPCKECKYYLDNIYECAKFDVLDVYCTHFVKSEIGNKKYIKLGKGNESNN